MATPNYGWPLPVGSDAPDTVKFLTILGDAADKTVKAVDGAAAAAQSTATAAQTTATAAQTTANAAKATATAADTKAQQALDTKQDKPVYGEFYAILHTGQVNHVVTGSGGWSSDSALTLDLMPVGAEHLPSPWLKVGGKRNPRGQNLFLGGYRLPSGYLGYNTTVLSCGDHDINLMWDFKQVTAISIGVDATHVGAIQTAPVTDWDGADSAPLPGDPAGMLAEVTPTTVEVAGVPHATFDPREVAAAAQAHGLPGGVAALGEGGAGCVSDHDLIAVLWSVVKHQQARLDALEARG